MKEIVIIMVALICFFTYHIGNYAFGNDEENTHFKKCGPMKYSVDSKVQVTDPANLWFKCKGVVKSRTSECNYIVRNLCNETTYDYFLESEIKEAK